MGPSAAIVGPELFASTRPETWRVGSLSAETTEMGPTTCTGPQQLPPPAPTVVVVVAPPLP